MEMKMVFGFAHNKDQIYCSYTINASNTFLILNYKSNTFNLWSIIVSGIDSLNVANHVITIIKSDLKTGLSNR